MPDRRSLYVLAMYYLPNALSMCSGIPALVNRFDCVVGFPAVSVMLTDFRAGIGGTVT